MPPYWALGFHQCRWGYKDLQEVKEVVSKFASNNVSMTTTPVKLWKFMVGVVGCVNIAGYGPHKP